ncbi:MAG: DinB family protein [Thermoanaerobaculia bacterium]
MDQRELYLSFWEREAPATRKVIGRVPESQAEYRPAPSSRAARDLAWLIVFEERALVDALEQGHLDWKEVASPPTVREVVETYDREHVEIAKRLRALPAKSWEGEVPFFFGGKEVMRGTGYALAWAFLFDQIHHRGQLSAYLRPMGAKVPAIYGPSADEPV